MSYIEDPCTKLIGGGGGGSKNRSLGNYRHIYKKKLMHEFHLIHTLLIKVLVGKVTEAEGEVEVSEEVGETSEAEEGSEVVMEARAGSAVTGK